MKEIDNNGFVEYAIVHGNMYGILKNLNFILVFILFLI